MIVKGKITSATNNITGEVFESKIGLDVEVYESDVVLKGSVLLWHPHNYKKSTILRGITNFYINDKMIKISDDLWTYEIEKAIN